MTTPTERGRVRYQLVLLYNQCIIEIYRCTEHALLLATDKIPNTYGHVFVQGKKEGKKYIYHQRKFSNTTFMDGDEK